MFPSAWTDESKTYSVILDGLRRKYKPQSSRWQSIVKFRSLQDPDEPLSRFADRCRQKASLCDFNNPDFNEGDVVKMATKIQLILGKRNQTLWDAAIQKNWTLEETLKNVFSKIRPWHLLLLPMKVIINMGRMQSNPSLIL